MIPVSDTLLFYAASGCSGEDFLAVFRWLFIDRETELTDRARRFAEVIADDQAALTKNRAQKAAYFQSLKHLRGA